MKKYLLLSVLAISFATPAYAWFGKGKNKSQEVTIGECAKSLARSTGASESLATRACSHGQTDGSFQSCAIGLVRNNLGSAKRIAEAGYFCANNLVGSSFVQNCTVQLQTYFGNDAQYIPYSVSLCRQAREDDFASCVGELFTQAGIQANTAANLCVNGRNKKLNKCLIGKYKETRNAQSSYGFCSNPVNLENYGNEGVKVTPLKEEPPIIKNSGNTNSGPRGNGSSSGPQIIQPSTSFSDADKQDSNDGGVLVDLPMPN